MKAAWPKEQDNMQATVDLCLWSLLFAAVFAFAAAESNLPGPPIFPKVDTFASDCYLPPDSGACDTEEARAKLRKHTSKKHEDKIEVRYYFDAITEDCYPFSFYRSHCSKNANNFSSLAKCRAFCSKAN